MLAVLHRSRSAWNVTANPSPTAAIRSGLPAYRYASAPAARQDVRDALNSHPTPEHALKQRELFSAEAGAQPRCRADRAMVLHEQPGAGFRFPPEFGHVALFAAHAGQCLESRPQRPPGSKSSAVSPYLLRGPERHHPIEPLFAENLAHLRDQFRGERRVAIGEVAIGELRGAPMLRRSAAAAAAGLVRDQAFPLEAIKVLTHRHGGD